MFDYAQGMFYATCLLIVTILIEIWAILGLRKDLRKLGKQLNENFTDIFKKIEPLITALNKATPFLEVINGIMNIFSKRKNKR